MAALPSRDLGRSIDVVQYAFKYFTKSGKIPTSVLRKISSERKIDWTCADRTLKAATEKEQEENENGIIDVEEGL